eukprot:112298_1
MRMYDSNTPYITHIIATASHGSDDIQGPRVLRPIGKRDTHRRVRGLNIPKFVEREMNERHNPRIVATRCKGVCSWISFWRLYDEHSIWMKRAMVHFIIIMKQGISEGKCVTTRHVDASGKAVLRAEISGDNMVRKHWYFDANETK